MGFPDVIHTFFFYEFQDISFPQSHSFPDLFWNSNLSFRSYFCFSHIVILSKDLYPYYIVRNRDSIDQLPHYFNKTSKSIDKQRPHC